MTMISNDLNERARACVYLYANGRYFRWVLLEFRYRRDRKRGTRHCCCFRYLLICIFTCKCEIFLGKTIANQIWNLNFTNASVRVNLSVDSSVAMLNKHQHESNRFDSWYCSVIHQTMKIQCAIRNDENRHSKKINWRHSMIWRHAFHRANSKFVYRN